MITLGPNPGRHASIPFLRFISVKKKLVFDFIQFFGHVLKIMWVSK